MEAKRKRKLIIWSSVAAVVIASVALGAYYLLTRDSGPAELASPWPVADRERSIEEPPAQRVWPLTGLAAPETNGPTTLRIVSVKVENSPVARPQSGIQSADVVYESITEGGITRFNCMFHSQVPKTVGPVRSARLSDVSIVPQYHALFAFSGANSQVNGAVRKAGIDNLSEDAGISYGYTRSTSHSAPHNLFLDLVKIREEAARRKMATEQVIAPLAFERVVAESTPTVTSISIPFSPANTSAWTYDAAADAYLRENNGKVHRDALTDKQISAKNVVVMWAKMTAAGRRDVAGSETYDIQLVGSNRVMVFRNGQSFSGTWEASADAPPTFKAEDGTLIRLTPGNTWFEVIPTTVNITTR